jgi:hypothetical protein
MNRLLAVACVLSSAFCLPATGTEPTDLGQGLAYFRIHSVAASADDLRKAAPGKGALVLDLRYATADEAAPALLRDVFALRPAGALLLVLVSPATPAALAPVIAASPAITLGAPGSLPLPKVTVQTDAAADRRAFDALETGTELSKLITGRLEKERFDEATLVQEFKNGDHEAAPPATPNPTAPKPEAGPAKETPPSAPIDRVLQRALHLHRALLALRR